MRVLFTGDNKIRDDRSFADSKNKPHVAWILSPRLVKGRS